METTTYIFSFVISFFLLLVVQKAFLKKKLIDPINKRSSHNVIATRSGGLSIYLSIFFVTTYYYLTGVDIYDYSVLVPLSLLLTVGLYDDIFRLDFKLKFIFQIIAAKILIDYGLIIDNFHGFLGIQNLNRVFAQFFTIFVIVGIINSINFIDGIDGLAASIVGLFLVLFEYFSNTQTGLTYLTYIILISLGAFLFFNLRSNNKVFLGDSGSLFLGGLVSVYVLNILSSEYIIKDAFDINKIIFVISILAYPFFDITRVFFLRIINKRSPFVADKNHIHHLILNKVKSQKVVLAIIFFSSLLFTIFIQLIK
ncbi:MAG: glycosyltransferase family 4 protein [Cytophagales bacterium]